MKRVLIVGGVAAGATAAARARRLDADAEITLLEAGPDVSFANCGLPYYIGGDIAHRSSLILSSPEVFYDQYRVEVHTWTEAIAIDRDAQRLQARNSQTGETREFPYDVLILAQGGKPIVPPLPGVDGDSVFQLWTLSDMDAIDAFLTQREPQTAVVVGGGFIGLEMVEALAKRGVAVSVVEMAPHIMPNLEPEMAGFLTRELQEFGIEVYTGVSLKSIEGEQAVLSDGSRLPAEMVLLSVGVRPTLALAREAGLEVGESGGLRVDARLQTSDPHIFAAGDMIEIEHAVQGARVRIPLAGPANRQGRIMAENALGGSRAYRGAMGTSVVKLFDAVAGSTGISLAAARAAGLPADAVVVHKLSHTAYYPGAEKVSLQLIYNRESGALLGAQAAGQVGVDKRLDVMATAIAGGLTVEDLQELDLAYAPPFNSPNGPVNMAAFTAGNRMNGFSPSVLARDFEAFAHEHLPVVIDLRDPISFRSAHLYGSNNLSQNQLRERMQELDNQQPILLISDDGQKGHVVLRMLSGAGFSRVWNLSGGYISLERHERALGYQDLQVGLFPLESRSIEDHVRGSGDEAGGDDAAAAEAAAATAADSSGPLIIDVRTAMEYAMGAHPDAINLELDELPEKADELGDRDREITLYCASGARSAYGVRLLQQLGFRNVKNGGGLHDMLG